METLKTLRYLEWKHSPSPHTVLNRAPSLFCMLPRTRVTVDAGFVVPQRNSQLHQLRRSRPLASSSAPPSGLGSQRPCALAADCAPEVSPSLVFPRSLPTVAREIGQHRKVETLRLGTEVVMTSNLCAERNIAQHRKVETLLLGTEVVMTSNLCAESRNNLPLHTQRR